MGDERSRSNRFVWEPGDVIIEVTQFRRTSQLPEDVRRVLTKPQQLEWMRVFNCTYEKTRGDHGVKRSAAHRAANDSSPATQILNRTDERA